MINPGVLLESFVAALRSMPELLALMEEDPDRIYGYFERFPEAINYRAALAKMMPPSIMVLFQGSRCRGASAVVRRSHEFSLFLRPAENSLDSRTSGVYGLFTAICDGIPAGQSLPLVNYTVLDGCFPMEEPSLERGVLVLSSEGPIIDYWEVRTAFTLIGG